MRNVPFFHGHGTVKPLIILTCYLIAGVALYAIAVQRAHRSGTIDVDRVEFEFGHQPGQRHDDWPNRIHTRY